MLNPKEAHTQAFFPLTTPSELSVSLSRDFILQSSVPSIRRPARDRRTRRLLWRLEDPERAISGVMLPIPASCSRVDQNQHDSGLQCTSRRIKQTPLEPRKKLATTK
jgi:hypothetical protein